MEYRNLGRSGVKLSALSFGSWISFGKQLDLKMAADCMSAARDYGINFFDNAEVYAHGKSEEIMGEILRKLAWPRISYLISTKFYWGITGELNATNTLNRKYLVQAMEGSLKRLQLDFVDLVFCHRPDPNTPIEETVWTMHNFIQRGQALYWGTSEWSAQQILEACEIADRHHLHRPIMEQPQYNLFHRERVEKEYSELYSKYGLGLTTWSPLASGLLTGKYLNGIPEGSRANMKSLAWLQDEIKDQPKQNKIKKYIKFCQEHNFQPAELAIAWCVKNPQVSTVITGASNLDQLHQNMKALEVLPKLNSNLMTQLDSIFGL